MDVAWLLAWWNLIFLVPLGLAILYLFAYTLSGWTFGDVDHDVETDFDADADVDHDIEHEIGHGGHFDADLDTDVEADVETDHDVEHGHHHHGPGALFAALSWLGVGHVPTSIVLMVLLLTYGAVGFALNQLLRPALGGSVALVSLPAALLAAFGVTAATSRLLAKAIPFDADGGVSRHQLVGRRGVVVLPVTESGGLVAVRDDQGDRYQVAARVSPGSSEIQGGDVVLVGYDADRSLYLVRSSDFAA